MSVFCFIKIIQPIGPNFSHLTLAGALNSRASTPNTSATSISWSPVTVLVNGGLCLLACMSVNHIRPVWLLHHWRLCTSLPVNLVLYILCTHKQDSEALDLFNMTQRLLFTPQSALHPLLSPNHELGFESLTNF